MLTSTQAPHHVIYDAPHSLSSSQFKITRSPCEVPRDSGKRRSCGFLGAQRYPVLVPVSCVRVSSQTCASQQSNACRVEHSQRKRRSRKVADKASVLFHEVAPFGSVFVFVLTNVVNCLILVADGALREHLPSPSLFWINSNKLS